ncbi:MAG TPA: SRPBCC domain-containing protein [Bacteroidia bacterium]|nr:SRPBCC domain-containing protein [Bacteroidia bacterium]
MENAPFIIERVYNAPVERVWKAISDKDEMKKWYFDLTAFKAEPGFEFQFTGESEANKTYLHLCRVKEVIVNRKLSYTWKYDGYEGESLVTIELFEEGTKTRLKLSHAGLESFPMSNPDFARTNFENGWNHIIGTSLQEHLQK